MSNWISTKSRLELNGIASVWIELKFNRDVCVSISNCGVKAQRPVESGAVVVWLYTLLFRIHLLYLALLFFLLCLSLPCVWQGVWLWLMLKQLSCWGPEAENKKRCWEMSWRGKRGMRGEESPIFVRMRIPASCEEETAGKPPFEFWQTRDKRKHAFNQRVVINIQALKSIRSDIYL